MEDYYAHAQQSATALRIHMNNSAAESSRAAGCNILFDLYGSTGNENPHHIPDCHRLQSSNTDEELLAFDDGSNSISTKTDDHNPVSAYFEIVTIRRLLLEHVGVVLGPGQLNSPDVQLNLIAPLWQAVRSRCGVCIRDAMRNSDYRARVDAKKHGSSGSFSELDGGPLPSAAILYAALANRDYFLVLAGAGQSQADLHESRAEVAEAISILCTKALHKLGGQTLSNALCAKFTPLDIDGFLAQTQAQVQQADADIDAGTDTDAVVHGDRHMSLLSPDERVRVYRLGKAGSVSKGTESPHSKVANNHAAKEYLSGGTRVLVERTLEVAIRSEAKKFTALKPVAEVVQLLWNGSLHWKGFSCVSLPSTLSSGALLLKQTTADVSSSSMQSNAECLPLVQKSSDSALNEYGLPFRDDSCWPRWVCLMERWLASALEPLRIPMVENTLIMIHAFFFLTLYTIVSFHRQSSLNIEEVILHICALAYIADEIRQCMENGLVVYLKSVWNILDVTIYGIFAAFFCLRVRSLYTGLSEDHDKAFDVLAINASMLWPRLFAVLDQFEFCGTVIIQVRRVISGTSLFFALLVVLTAGFFHSFFALSQRHNELGAKSIWGLMARIFFGSALVGWDQADLFGPYVGYLVMSMYITVSMLILYNILIGVINQCMVEISQNSAQEFRFAYTMRVVEYVSAKQTYPCVPPLNILQMLVFWPLRKTTALSQRAFALFRSTVLLIAYAPHLLLYSVYKSISLWWQAKSGSHSKSLKMECHLAEKELAWIKIRKDEIDEFAYSAGSNECDLSSEENEEQQQRHQDGYAKCLSPQMIERN
ncbi:hypothetical protein FB639_003748, partial [Coemansia asiatica]